MSKAAKAIAILAILFMMYMNFQLINFYANSAEYLLGSIFGPLFGNAPTTAETLMLMNFGVGAVAIIGTAAS